MILLKKCFLQAMWLMLQQEKPENYVIATNEKHKVREFVELAFEHVGKRIKWEGSGLNEVGKEEGTGIVRVRVDEKYFRPTEVVSSIFLNFKLLGITLRFMLMKYFCRMEIIKRFESQFVL